MDIVQDLAMLRAEAETLMTDWSVVSRMPAASGSPVIDPVTGLPTGSVPAVIYSGPSLIRVPGTVSTGKTRPTAGDVASIFSSILAIPISGPALKVDDEVTITASRDNPNLVGLVFTVKGILPASHPTKQRVTVEVVVG